MTIIINNKFYIYPIKLMINNNIDDVEKTFMAKYSWDFIIYIQILTKYAGQTSNFFFFNNFVSVCPK